MSINDQGINSERYKIIPRTLIFLTKQDKILFLKGSENKKNFANKFNGIGGHIERGENILESAKRELYEETGLKPDALWLCGIVTVDTGLSTGIGIFVFRGEFSRGEPKESNEGDLKWLNISDYHKFPLVDDLYSLLPIILAMRPGNPPFFAQSTYDENGRMIVKYTQ